MITVAKVLASFIPAKHLWEEFAMLRGMQRVVPQPPSSLCVFYWGEKSYRFSFLHPRRKSRAGRIAKEIHCYIMHWSVCGRL